MSNEDKFEIGGVVTKVIPGGKFIVNVQNQIGGSYDVTCTISGKMRMNKIRVLLDDTVLIRIPVCDVTKGIIIRREKNNEKTEDIISTND